LKDIFDIQNLEVELISKSFGLKTTPYVNVKALDIGVEASMEKKRKKDTKWIKNKKVKTDE
jgi:hypothetical protein